MTEDQARLIDECVQRVAELPDRTSPDDWPDAMLVTADELRRILETVLLGRPVGPAETEEQYEHATRSKLSTAMPEVREVLRPDNELRPPVQTEQKGSSQSPARVSRLAAPAVVPAAPKEKCNPCDIEWVGQRDEVRIWKCRNCGRELS
jgi:hypothetical protein